MADIQREATSIWSGDARSGSGKVSSTSGALKDVTITFPSRFEDGKGSNPEELIAAAHASCFNMALTLALTQQGHPPKTLTTRAIVTMSKEDNGFEITEVHLDTEGDVPGMDETVFRGTAEHAKENCPVSVLLSGSLEALTLEARLVGAAAKAHSAG